MKKISYTQLDDESVTSALNQKYDIKGSSSATLSNANLYTDTQMNNLKFNFMEVTIPTEKWTSESKTAVMTFDEGIIEANTLVLVGSSVESIPTYDNCSIRCTAQSKNTLTFSCEKIPEISIKVNVLYTNQYKS